MKNRPLSDEEIRRAVGKIRHQYDDYIVTYTKPFRLKKEFDDRYYQALRSRIDLSGFVLAELEVIRELKKKEEVRRIEDYERRHHKVAPHEHGKTPTESSGLADRVLAKHRKQIEAYPDLPLDPRGAFEIKKLFGALGAFERDYWPPFESVLRHLYPAYYSNPRIELEPRIYALCPGPGTIPPILSRYEALLLRLPRGLHDIEWEEKRLVTEAAYFLHQVIDVINRLPVLYCTEEERVTVEKTKEFVHILIADFRLKDLKPENLGGK